MIGEKIIRFDLIDSTNTYAIENYKHLHDGDVIVARKQIRGRGRHGRNWHSPSGGLWFSVVFKPRKIKNMNFYTKLVSVSLHEFLEEIGIKTTIKWPNDILYKRKKLAGILTEGIYGGIKPEVIVVGIGLNVNNNIPKELSDVAISMREIKKEEFSIDYILKKLIAIMNRNKRKYSMRPGALTRVWKNRLDIKEGDEITYNGKTCKIKEIRQDKLILFCNGEIMEAVDLHR
ncbi:MAG: biotin--[acetyl-CoA-carboxylase] ligase [Thermotogaceae bacterium]|nr:biotin--[acetyl-CoA-carboxylase] ligase [Thermotogaceae bacterium]